jgi:Domain of unknown function (DUF4259)
MGAWGSGNFENDSALDWVADLGDPGDVRRALETTARGEAHYIDADEGSAALAAAEVVAASLGNPPSDVTEEITTFVARHDVSDLAPLAREVVDRVASNHDDSELYDLWEEADSLDEWSGVLDGLRSRLAGAAG